MATFADGALFSALETKDGAMVDVASALAGKIVALYFSAHWSVLAHERNKQTPLNAKPRLPPHRTQVPAMPGVHTEAGGGLRRAEEGRGRAAL